MKLFNYFTEKYEVEDYFFGCYIENNVRTEFPSFFVRKGNNHVYDILKKCDVF